MIWRLRAAAIVRGVVGIVGPLSGVARGVAEAAGEKVEGLDQVDDLLGMGEHVAGKLETMTDDDEDRLLGKLVKASAKAASAEVGKRRVRKPAKARSKKPAVRLAGKAR